MADTPGKPLRSEVELPWPVMVLLAPLVCWALAHAVLTRTLDDFVRYPLYFVVPTTALGYLVVLVAWWRAGLRRPSGEELALLVFAPIGGYCFAAVYYAMGASLKDLYLWLQSPSLSTNGAIALAVGVTFALGLLLFYFRLRLRSIYGLSEALVGGAVAAYRVSTDIGKAGSDPGFYLAMLTAGVYLVVRGFDNVHQGLSKDPKDPLATRLLSYLRGTGARAQAANASRQHDAA